MNYFGITIICNNYIFSFSETVYDRRESPLTPDEAEQYHIAKQKMLGNIKFIGKHLVSLNTPLTVQFMCRISLSDINP